MFKRPTKPSSRPLHQRLVGAKAFLSPQDAKFAQSLADGWQVYESWTEKQAHWAQVLVTRAENEFRRRQQAASEPAPVEPARDTQYAKLWDMFTKASVGVKNPILRLQLDNGHICDIEESDISEKYPKPALFCETGRGWVGRITYEGEFIGRRDAPPEIVQDTLATARAIRAFLADPAGYAAAYGHKTGACCFCRKKLTHPSSEQVGYGPDCAARWGLPHTYVEPTKAPKRARTRKAS